jgi:hypothetical protein
LDSDPGGQIPAMHFVNPLDYPRPPSPISYEVKVVKGGSLVYGPGLNHNSGVGINIYKNGKLAAGDSTGGIYLSYIGDDHDNVLWIQFVKFEFSPLLIKAETLSLAIGLER